TTGQLAAFAKLSNGSEINIGDQATWISTNPSVITVAAAGSISAVAPGQSTVSATYQGKTGTISLTVMPDISALTVTGTVAMTYSPASTVLQTTQVGALATLTQFHECTPQGVRYSTNGFYDTTCDITAFANWSSSNTSVLTVTNGQLTAVGAG